MYATLKFSGVSTTCVEDLFTVFNNESSVNKQYFIK